jgi:peptide/nickel transport system substrate-binding protein
MDTSQFTSTLKKTPSLFKVLYRSLTPERVILFWTLLFISIVLIFSAIMVWNRRFLITIPSYGGEIREGIVGTPRFINPVLATSEQDADLTSLVYAGLTKRDSLGNPVLDMAESIVESENKLSYTVTLKPNAKFHNGSSVTIDDVIYTINLIQNPTIKSPHRIEWEGVTMEKRSDREMVFTLKRPYPLFMDILTIGILPRNLWKNLTDEQFSLSDYNIRAVGSGPYKIADIKTVSGIPRVFILEAHEEYTLGRPYIDTLTITSYQNERYAIQAFSNGDIDRIHGIAPQTVQTLGIASSSVHTSLLPRTFTVFFNPNKASMLSEKRVRQGLQAAINKEAIVSSVLLNYGKVINGPYPFDEEAASSTYNVTRAQELLTGSRAYKANQNLEITLATANTEEMRKVAEMIKADWEAVGVKTNIAVYEVSDLNQSVIRDRNFQALLFGSITTSPTDLYAFWHSSQRSYPGLNISNYVSNRLDRNLEILRTDSDMLARAAAYDEVKKEFADEVPGIFLFAPALIYVTEDKANTMLPIFSISNASRFALVESWHRYTERVWPQTYFKDIMRTVENAIH